MEPWNFEFLEVELEPENRSFHEAKSLARPQEKEMSRKKQVLSKS